jgi:glycosyltransferase involved in cell wall biosynthesis
MKLSIILPTYNNEQTIEACLRSIVSQDWPPDDYEILLIDGGSSDATLSIATGFSVKVVANPRRNEEAARILGTRLATGEILCFIDADNVLVGQDWIRRMLEPFSDGEIAFADTLYFSSRPDDPVGVKYQALIGGDDPIVMYLGAYSRWCQLTGDWTGFPHHDEDCGNYLKCRLLDRNLVPPMGSNGFLVRTILLRNFVQDTFIHSDVVHQMVNGGHEHFAKVKVGIVHDQPVFFPNKVRRIKRRLNGEVRIQYNYGMSAATLAGTALYIAAVLPVLVDAVRGFVKKPCTTWLFHPVACLGEVAIYSYYTLKKGLGLKA